MNSTLVLIAVILVLAIILAAVIPPLIMLLAGAVPLILAIMGIVSCVRTDKPRNTKILWIIIIVLAPIIGPILWFVWGKKNT